jgi:hypothetical protein
LGEAIIMVSCKVELFGLPGDITDLRNIEVDLDQGTGLSDLIARLRQKIPALEGRIFVPGENKLTRYYVFNINGRFHMNDSKIQIQSSDHILLLAFPLGG